MEHIDCSRIKAVYCIDLNQSYLDACRETYMNLKDFLVLKKSDLSDLENVLPAADSPYAEAFNEIASLHRDIEKDSLLKSMSAIG